MTAETPRATPGVATRLQVGEPRVQPAVPGALSSIGEVPPVADGDPCIAVFIVHGMGQQVPFETLHAVATTIRETHERAGGRTTDHVARFVNVHDQWLPRVEMTLEPPADSAEPGSRIHCYEAYWAPLTEGQVGWLDVLRFLAQAARRGLSVPFGGFTRWMFDAFVPCRLSARGRWNLLVAAIAIGIVGALGPLLVAYPIVAVGGAFLTGMLDVWDLEIVRRIGGLAAMLGRALLATIGVGLLAASVRFGSTAPDERARSKRSSVVLAAAGLLAIALVLWDFLPHVLPLQRLLVRRLLDTVLAHWLLALAGGAVALVVRYFMVQYVGDVAAYVSAHTVSRFAELRGAIQKVGRDVAHVVYGALDDRNRLLYTDVVVLGHSLGSVIAYDVLNESIRRDLALQQLGKGSLRVVERTRTFLTFGSPLDKTAFFFRTQKDELLVREVLAAAMQPMIVDVRYRPARWVNLWSPWDWISGALDYYSDPQQPGSMVENVVDEEAPVWPVGAHTGYWRRGAFAGALHEAICTALRGRGGQGS